MHKPSPASFVYSYNSNHLQLAAAVAVTVTGLDIQQVIQKYLVTAFGMEDSSYPGRCPDFGADLYTTGADYEKFMKKLLGYEVYKKSLIDESEVDATPFMKDFYTLYGDYGFGHFLMCFDSVKGFTKECEEAHCHMDPGAFGFIPLYDRKNNYYMQVVAAEIPPTGYYPLSGIPEYLAVAIKPHVDAIMTKSVSTNPMEPCMNRVSFKLICSDRKACKLHPNLIPGSDFNIRQEPIPRTYEQPGSETAMEVFSQGRWAPSRAILYVYTPLD
ncbi:unnamed protein product [Symbiodinium sp. CCMP2456]|nr:unnamed protein product [Symbiodinium sp. CCMP2456]